MKWKNLWNRITYYGVLQYFLFAVALAASNNYLIDLICLSAEISNRSSTYSAVCNIVPIALAALWGYLFINHLRDKRYYFLTGRNYQKDHGDYKKTYGYLTQFFTTNDPYKMDIDRTGYPGSWHTAEGVILCKCRDKYGQYRTIKRDSNANGNLISFGLPGSGKSTTQAATSAARFNADLVDGGCGVFAISIKGDLLNFVSGKRKNIKVFTPDKAEGSCHYDPLYGVNEMNWTERRIFAENMAIIINPEEAGENSQYFTGGARDYFTAILLYLLHLHDTGSKEGLLTFPELVDTILSTDVFTITLTLQSCDLSIPGEYTNGYIGSNEKNVSGIWGNLCKNVRPFNSGALRELFDGQGDCIRPEDLNTCDIYIDVPQDKYQVYAPAMAVIVTNFLQAFMRRDDVSANKDVVPILFLLDEVIQLRLDFSILSRSMSTLRSKKVSLFLLCQSVAQLSGLYGDAHAREIMDLCAYISVFNAQDPTSRRYFQDLVGRRKMLKKSTSLSSSSKNTTSGDSVSVADEYIFEAADFGDLSAYNARTKKRTNRVLVYASGKYVLGETTPCYE